jgi:Contractile injection system tube protein
MSLLNLFKLEKLKIEAYADEKRKPPASQSMEVMFNPTTYKRSATIAYAGKSRRAMNSASSAAKYSHTPPPQMSFEFLLDGTGAAFFGAEHLARVIRQKSVKKDVEAFEKLCLKMNGKIHQPNFLKVVWGDHLDFSARLTALDITYELFDEGGDPIRAKLNATFTEDIPTDTGAKAAGKMSPDLTHLRVVKSGDTLPLLCKEIYGSSRHYLRVAADNGLDDFRNLVPGQKLRFPPLT